MLLATLFLIRLVAFWLIIGQNGIVNLTPPSNSKTITDAYRLDSGISKLYSNLRELSTVFCGVIFDYLRKECPVIEGNYANIIPGREPTPRETPMALGKLIL